LAIIPRPRARDWLEDEVLAWRAAGINAVVSLLTPEEIHELELEREAELCAAQGIELIGFPVTDRSVPRSVREATAMVQKLEDLLTAGKSVAIHCRAGVGRSALLAASLLVASGIDPDAAFERVRVARGCGVPDTSEQRAWVTRFARDFIATRARDANRGS
jgi:protein-tyrosine phosphatase